ncbi:hypothetical protein GH714_021886 [Hevea brasiliensis]|uniref:SAC domain-containing protein n=1 Tax=Hevea brasiliensis TaxID=3981 RepID=A0A6A6LAP2_HEVBR|nr:hypothetical protein GH714_021886 [Hevea brasiliensis]
MHSVQGCFSRDLTAGFGDHARIGSGDEIPSSTLNQERENDSSQQNQQNKVGGETPQFQSGVLRTNCIDCIDRTNVAQYAYGLAALGHQLHAMGLTDIPKVDPDSTIAAALMDMYQSMGDALAQQYGGSAAHNTVFLERQGKWKATTQSREFLKSIKRYYSNAYTDGEKQDAINLFLGYFRPQEGKPALWELDTDYYLHLGIKDDLDPEMSTPKTSAKPEGVGIILAPVPACREDFSRVKLTSFDKLIKRTCGAIKNVRLCCEPDQRPGGGVGNSGVAPDAAEIQLKSPNWLFGHRKYAVSGSVPKAAQRETENGGSSKDIGVDGSYDLDWLSSVGDMNEEDIFQRYLAMTSVDEASGWYGGHYLEIKMKTARFTNIMQNYVRYDPAMEPFQHDLEREEHYANILRLNTVDVMMDDATVEAEMEAALEQYSQVGADLGINTNILQILC